jgi:CspA family cold shock protein
MSEQVSGVVKWFNQAMCYGFITGDDGSDVLVHSHQIVDGTFLTGGMRVTYIAVDGSEGLQAKQVHIVE